MSKVATKLEVLQRLSTILRRRETLTDDEFIKTMRLYIKLRGWDKTPTPSPVTKQPVKTPSPLELVLEQERKRRAEGSR